MLNVRPAEQEENSYERFAVIRHGIRGCLNSIKLCTSALELQCTLEEQIEFIDDIINSAGSMSGLLDRLESLPQSDPPSDPSNAHRSPNNS
jgi:hypothetical protein